MSDTIKSAEYEVEIMLGSAIKTPVTRRYITDGVSWYYTDMATPGWKRCVTPVQVVARGVIATAVGEARQARIVEVARSLLPR